MRKDSINSEAIEKAYLIYKEHGHQIVDYDFSHPPTDYARNTVQEPEVTSKLREAYNELTPANVMNGERYEDLEEQAEALNLRIDEQQNKLRECRMRGNFQEFHRCMQEMQNMIKEKERLDARMAVAAPGGNAGQKQMDDYKRTMDQSDSYSEMQDIGSKIAALEEKLREFMGE
jgi:predicted  nucleic acid-binding Zn-ribbon protein